MDFYLVVSFIGQSGPRQDLQSLQTASPPSKCVVIQVKSGEMIEPARRRNFCLVDPPIVARNHHFQIRGRK